MRSNNTITSSFALCTSALLRASDAELELREKSTYKSTLLQRGIRTLPNTTKIREVVRIFTSSLCSRILLDFCISGSPLTLGGLRLKLFQTPALRLHPSLSIYRTIIGPSEGKFLHCIDYKPQPAILVPPALPVDQRRWHALPVTLVGSSFCAVVLVLLCSISCLLRLVQAV
jgi:hypothetical protein